jgi:hypothetical protein
MFFSEEKNQKTFIPSPVPRYGTWPDGGRSAEHKSLLLLFFRKEGLFFILAVCCSVRPPPRPSPQGGGSFGFLQADFL